MGTFIGSHGVGLGENRNDIDFVVEPLHKLYIQRFQTVPWGLNEIQANVNAVVSHGLTLNTWLGVQVLLVFRLDVIHNRLPTATKEFIFIQKSIYGFQGILFLLFLCRKGKKWRDSSFFLSLQFDFLFESMNWIWSEPPKRDSNQNNTAKSFLIYQLLLSTASPNPGVSTTVNVKLTPFSFSNAWHCSTFINTRQTLTSWNHVYVSISTVASTMRCLL